MNINGFIALSLALGVLWVGVVWVSFEYVSTSMSPQVMVAPHSY